MFPPEAYIYHTHPLLPYLQEHIQSSSSCRVALCPFPSRTSARTEIGRACLRNRRLASRHLLGCCGQSGFYGASSATAHRRVRCLLPGGRPADRDRLLRLLPGGRSRDCTANIFLLRLWSATSSNALCRLVRMEPPVPSALVPPLGTILNDCFSFSVCLLLLQ